MRTEIPQILLSQQAFNAAEEDICFATFRSWREVDEWERVIKDLLFNRYKILAETRARVYCVNNKPERSQLSDLDILQSAYYGLMNAFDVYIPFGGASFKTFSYRRIIGAIIDNIREMNELPRDISLNRRTIEKMRLKLSNKLGRNVTDYECIQHFGVENIEIFEDALVNSVILTQVTTSEDSRDISVLDAVVDERLLPEKISDSKEQMHQLVSDTVDDKEARQCACLYYIYNQNTTTISQSLRISKSKVTRKIDYALRKIKPRLAEMNNIHIREYVDGETPEI